MGNPKGVKRDFNELEKRRLQAARLFDRGHSRAEVARKTGVSFESANRWYKAWQNGGTSALKKAGRAGRKPTLDSFALLRIQERLERGPESLGYVTQIWTTKRVAELIEQECGKKFHPGHVWKILRQMGWSCQRPTGRAVERDEQKIQKWKRYRWPRLKKKRSNKAKQ